MSFTPFKRQTLCIFDVLRLRALVAAAQQDDDRGSPLLEVDAVARALVDSQFTDATADGFGIARQPKCQTVQPRSNQHTCPLIFEPNSPFPESFCLLEFQHRGDCSSKNTLADCFKMNAAACPSRRQRNVLRFLCQALTFFDTVKILRTQGQIMGMNVNLTPQLEALVHSKVNSGMYTSASEVVREALRLMDELDLLRQVKFDALRSEVRKGLDSGASEPWDATAVKAKARAR